ncbi:hypothetical protein RYZ27_12875 [Hyphomonas sp. FCG-A18]|jgi:hypothetical protein|uniref:hypothetical protein n=1 Tax=Hyphomonas sp. FCG-A18 TaxID=3080019 RepID=UPI002B283956|nr:hypothetical protein RYZ27_12875 [Hyphomonas sp. FCG-A18]
MKKVLFTAALLALAPIAGATTVNVSYSEDFAEKLTDDYGEREGVKLSEEITEDLIREFEKKGVSVARIDVMIIDAQPNRPTFKQLGDRPGLDAIRSISIGGMSLEGTAYDAEGNVLGTKQYDWFETDIRDAVGAGTWTDARRASDRFARRFATDLSD